ncbi:MAG: hypothetical protein LLG16_07210 [Euryarchaeota archaeon]|nr:hypothetical protein [Euryarchaeota archaeon]
MQIITSPASADDGSEDDEGGFHVPLMVLAGLLGLMAGLSGMRNSRIKAVSSLFPKIVPRVFHRWISITYYLVFFGTFIAWSIVYSGGDGELFHTLHGQIGLLAVVLGVTGIVTGLVMMKRPVKIWKVHWVSNMGSFLLLILAMLTGAGLD